MPILCIKIDSDKTKHAKRSEFQVKKQPLRLVMIHYDFYDPATDLAATDLYTKSLKIRLPFFDTHNYTTNAHGRSDFDIPIDRNQSSKIITGIDGLIFDPTIDIDPNLVGQGEIYHNVGVNDIRQYSGYYTDPADPATLVTRGVTVSLYYEYDLVKFDN